MCAGKKGDQRDNVPVVPYIGQTGAILKDLGSIGLHRASVWGFFSGVSVIILGHPPRSDSV